MVMIYFEQYITQQIIVHNPIRGIDSKHDTGRSSTHASVERSLT